MKRTLTNFVVILLVLPFLLLIPVISAFAQSAPTWSGNVTCQLDDEEQGVYQRQETQTWTLTGGGPISSTGMPVYNATWTASGHGALQRTQGTQTVNIQWTVNVPSQPATIAIVIRASDGQLMIKPWHTQLRLDNAIAGTRQVIVNGVAQQPVQFSRAAWEWQFPRIEVSPSDNVTGTSQSQADTGGADFEHHFGGMPPNASCRWQLTKGGQPTTTQPSNMPGGGNNTGNSGFTSNNQSSNSGNSGASNPTTTNPNQNCESPSTVQQSFETMKATLQTQYNQLIQGTSDPNEITSLQNQEQRMLANLNNQEQHDMAAAAQGCVQASSNQGSNPSVGNTPTGTTANAGNNSNSSSGSNVGSTPTSSNGSNPTGQNSTGTGQGNQSGSGSSNSLVSLTTSSSGNGSGNVAITPFGASCGANCMQYSPGTTVTVIAVPNGGSMFSSFSGGTCGSTNPCGFTITTPVTVSATFNLSSSGSSSTTTGGSSTSGSSTSQTGSSSSGSSGSNSSGTSSGMVVGTPSHQTASLALLTGISPATNNGQSNLTVTLTGQRTHFAAGSTVSFARVAMSGNSTSAIPKVAVLATTAAAPPLVQSGQVQASTPTTLNVPLTMTPASAAGTYNITVTTPTSTGTETVTLNNAFTVSTAPVLNITPGTMGNTGISKNTGSSQTPPAPASGKYRAVITGLMCMAHISSDDAIYVAAVVRQYDRRNNQNTMFTNMNTWVYGDVNGLQGQRKQAGTRGPGGGIGDGDFVPSGFMPGIRDTLPTPQVNNLLPMTLWEGTLTDSVDALVISPSLWINYGDNPFFSTWNQNEDSFTNSIFSDSRVQNQINSQTLGTLVLGSSQTVGGSLVQGAASDAAQAVIDTVLVIPFVELQGNPSHDRPVGVSDANSSDPTSSMILPNTTLVLTREMIEKRLSSNSWTMMSIDFKDTAQGMGGLAGSDHRGEYMMFIQIERQ